jgi:hypothetical protein
MAMNIIKPTADLKIPPPEGAELFALFILLASNIYCTLVIYVLKGFAGLTSGNLLHPPNRHSGALKLKSNFI